MYVRTYVYGTHIPPISDEMWNFAVGYSSDEKLATGRFKGSKGYQLESLLVAVRPLQFLYH
jgi:hypothetical protein